MEFFVYSRDAAGTGELRDDLELLEEHWSYMDRFAESMIARGPTLDADRETATGSLHVLALPGADSVHEFVALEPNNLAGIYGVHCSSGSRTSSDAPCGSFGGTGQSRVSWS